MSEVSVMREEFHDHRIGNEKVPKDMPPSNEDDSVDEVDEPEEVVDCASESSIFHVTYMFPVFVFLR